MVSKMGDIYREAARVADMIANTHLTMNQCIEGDCPPYWLDHSPESLSFAIAIVENKPVFPGDMLWHCDGTKYTIEDVETHKDGRSAFRSTSDNANDGDWVENYSWTKPDKFTHLRKARAEGKRI